MTVLSSKPLGEAETRLDVFPVRIPVAAHAGAVEQLSAMKRTQAGYGERRHNIWIEPVHAIVAFGSGQGHVVAKSQIQSQFGSDLPVVLDESGILKVFRRRLELDLVVSARHPSTGPS